VLDVERGGERFTLTPSRNYYTAPGTESRGAIRRFFEGEATSEVAVRWGLREDLWTAVRPDLRLLEEPIARADRQFADPRFADAHGLIVASLVERYRQQAPPAYFRTLVSPLVAWIWIGGGILLLGGLVAAWPAPGAAERRLRSLYAARVGRELSRA
jgi:cytochrome c-type biogenesis protein CcmF